MFGSRTILATVFALTTVAGTCIAFAGENGHETDQQDELSAVTSAKTSLSQAIAAAEQETGGKAVDTGLENQDGVMAYEIEIAKGNTLQRVLIDLDSGKVIKVMAGDANHEDGENENHDDHGEHENE
jgi:uncharacterized membrane protein YkoI